MVGGGRMVDQSVLVIFGTRNMPNSENIAFIDISLQNIHILSAYLCYRTNKKNEFSEFFGGFLDFFVTKINIQLSLFCSFSWYPFFFLVDLHKFGTTRIALLVDTILEHEETWKRSIFRSIYRYASRAPTSFFKLWMLCYSHSGC